MRHFLLVALCGVSLVGCGGSSTGSAGGVGFDQIERNALNLYVKVSDLPITTPSSIQTNGSANYDGYLGLSVPPNAVIGEMNLSINFASNSFSGTVGNFIYSDEERSTGVLTIRNGRLDRGVDPDSEYQIHADLNGVVTDSEGSIAVYAELYGDFLGANGNAIGGIVEGTLTTTRYGTIVIPEGSGLFSVERQ